jgi:hypothetical protein
MVPWFLFLVLQTKLQIPVCMDNNSPVQSLAEDLVRALARKIYQTGNFIVADALHASCPISFVSEGFCNLTGIA